MSDGLMCKHDKKGGEIRSVMSAEECRLNAQAPTTLS